MPDQIDATAKIGDHLGQITGQRTIAGIRIMRTVAMIAQIDGDDATAFGQPACLCTQIPALTVKAMDQQDGQAAFRPECVMMKLHPNTLERLARRCHPVYRADMTNTPTSFEDIPAMADEVAILMASRFGGARRGERPPLLQMVRRRGGALPARLRRRAARLAKAGHLAGQPKVARQLSLEDAARDHAALIAHLRPLGEISRWQGRAIGFTASIVLGFLVLVAVALWVMVKRGML